jgi:hypothetical protein
LPMRFTEQPPAPSNSSVHSSIRIFYHRVPGRGEMFIRVQLIPLPKSAGNFTYNLRSIIIYAVM